MLKKFIKFQTCLFLLFFSKFTFSYEFNIQAEYLFSDKKGKYTTAKGNVYFKSEDAEVFSNSITVNEEIKVITADGIVIFKQNDKQIEGNSLWYDYENERYYFHQPKGWIKIEGISENVYFKCKIIDGSKQKITLINGSFNTCGPHCTEEYNISASRINIYPDKKIVARNVLYYISKHKLFYSPFFVQSFKETERKNIPLYGYNKSEGLYLKSNYPYVESPSLTGIFILNYMSKKGVGYGVDNNYTLSKVGKGKIYFYTNKEKNTNFTTNNYNLSQALQIGKFITGNISYIKNNSYSIFGPRISNFSENLSLQRIKSQNSSTSINVIRNGNIGMPATINSNFVHSQRLFKNVNSNINLKYTDQPIYNLNVSNQEINAIYTISGQIKKIPYSIFYDARFDPDGDSYALDDTQFSSIYRRTPEISFSLNQNNIKKIKYIGDFIIKFVPISTLNLKFGNYEKGPVNKKIIKQNEISLIASKIIKLGNILPLKSASTFSITENFTQSIFDTGDAMYKSQLTCNWTVPLFKQSSLQLNYQDLKDNGGNPFGLINIFPTQKLLNGSLTLRKHQKHQLALTTSYNYISRTYTPLTINYILKPSKTISLTFSTSRTIKQAGHLPKFAPLQFNALVSKKNFSLNFGQSYDIEKKTVTNSVAQFQIIKKDGLTIRGNLSHPKREKKSFIKDIIITKRRCCTQWQFIYRQPSREYSILFNMLGFPMEEVGFSSSEKGFLPYLPTKPLEQLQQGQFPLK